MINCNCLLNVNTCWFYAFSKSLLNKLFNFLALIPQLLCITHMQQIIVSSTFITLLQGIVEMIDATRIIGNYRTYTKHGPRSMDHPRGPGPWTTLWTVDLVHGPGPWTTLMDLVHGPPLGLIFIIHVHAQYICGFHSMVDSGRKITVGLWTLADHNLPMSDEIPTVVGVVALDILHPIITMIG